VAAALVSGAGVIVSDNTKDLPADRLPPGILAVRAARFAYDTVLIDPGLAFQLVQRIGGRYVSPPRRVQELLTVLRERFGMAAAIELMRDR